MRKEGGNLIGAVGGWRPFRDFRKACAEVSCKTFEELKAKGVEFVSEPKDQFYGVEAVFKDPFGNWFSLTQPKNY